MKVTAILCQLMLLAARFASGQSATAQLVQQKFYGTSQREEGGTSVALRGGGYLLAGSRQLNSGAGAAQLYLVRVNAVGDTLWTRKYAMPPLAGFYVQGLCENAAGQVLTCLSGAQANNPLDREGMLVLSNAQGDTLWTRKMITPGEDTYYSPLLAADGNFILLGSELSTSYWMKINAQRQVLNRVPIYYSATAQGGAGYMFPDNTSAGGYWLVAGDGQLTGRKFMHISETGVLGAEKQLYIDRNGWGFVNDVQPISTGGYMICLDGRVARFTSSLDTVWTRYFRQTTTRYYSASMSRPLPDGNFVMAGGYYYATGNKIALVKFSPLGQQLRDTVMIQTLGAENCRSLHVESGTGNYVFTGFTTAGPRGSSDLFFGIRRQWTITGTKSAVVTGPRPLVLYPNPAREQVRMQAPERLAGALRLLDVLGREVRRWPAGGLSQELSLTGLPAGLFILHGTSQQGQPYAARLVVE